MYGMHRDKLCLLPHDPFWKDDFLLEKHRITSVLQDSSVQIEHVGSTSIPNIHAKPILDLAILCGKRGIEPVAQSLQELGYDYRGLYTEQIGRNYAVLDQNKVRLCQAHIYSEPSVDWLSQLCFRNVLRESPDLAREYDEYKLKLAETISDKSEYAKVKTLWVDAFILKVYARNPQPFP